MRFSISLILPLLWGYTGFAQTVSTIVLQPDQACATETMIWRLDTQTGPFGTTNINTYDGIQYLPIMNWTWNGSPGQRFILLDFLRHLDIPTDVIVLEAKLSLFAPDEPTSDGFHSLQSSTGLPSIGLIQRITTQWDPTTVTWNTQPNYTDLNEVVLPAPSSETQDYLDIDVTAIIRDQVANPEEGHGMMIRMRETDYYRKLVFAGSAAEDPELRPRLVIQYEGSAIAEDSFSADLLTNEETICPDESLTIAANNPDEISTYLWSTGESTPTITVDTPGTYSLTATIGDCFEFTDMIDVILDDCNPGTPEDCRVFFPDIFSPNRDGVNDRFGVFYNEICPLENFQLEIYNRWGQQVFQSINPAEGWRGQVNGKEAGSDVYIYHVQYTNINTQEHVKQSGQLTLIR